MLTHASYLAGNRNSGSLALPARFGDVGVAIFFVLSGFLITRPYSVAHLEGRKPRAALGFWWRRLLRILPAYWFALTFFWGMHHLHPFGFSLGFELGPQWWKYYLLLQIYSPYLGQGGISQSWSVATEVSFYVMVPLWSLGVRALCRRGPASLRLLMGVVGGVFALGYLSRWWFSHNTTLSVASSTLIPGGVSLRAMSFTWLPNQIDLFAIGMAIAVVHAWATTHDYLDALGRWCRLPSLWWLAALGCYAIAVYGLGDTPVTGYKSTYWQLRQVLYGAIGLFLLVPLVFGDQRIGLVRRFVAWKPIWWIGTVSYAFYLWHLGWMERLVTTPGAFGGPPVWHGIFGWRLGSASLAGLMVGGFVLGLASAAVSWYLLEKPLQRFKNLFDRSKRPLPGDRPDPVSV